MPQVCDPDVLNRLSKLGPKPLNETLRLCLRISSTSSASHARLDYSYSYRQVGSVTHTHTHTHTQSKNGPKKLPTCSLGSQPQGIAQAEGVGQDIVAAALLPRPPQQLPALTTSERPKYYSGFRGFRQNQVAFLLGSYCYSWVFQSLLLPQLHWQDVALKAFHGFPCLRHEDKATHWRKEHLEDCAGLLASACEQSASTVLHPCWPRSCCWPVPHKPIKSEPPWWSSQRRTTASSACSRSAGCPLNGRTLPKAESMPQEWPGTGTRWYTPGRCIFAPVASLAASAAHATTAHAALEHTEHLSLQGRGISS